LPERLPELELFQDPGGLPAPRRGRWLAGAAVLHFAILAALILLPIFWPEPLFDAGFDPVRVLIYDPPPPPPPPLPMGSPQGGRSARVAPAEPKPAPEPEATSPREASLVAPVVKPDIDEGVGLTVETPGSPHGSDSGVPEGMEEGVEGGVVGGIPGGVIGGVIGGTGTGPVPVPVRDVDRAPRLLRVVKPTYPSDAFVKKIEGTVLLEIVIDDRGSVVKTRIVQSIPLLDAAAIAAVRQWIFAPAVQRGRPVATIALAPVSFRLY
jgi:protein TonB